MSRLSDQRETFAGALRTTLDVLGVSNAELARRIKCSPTLIRNYTEGKNTPRADMVVALEDALELAPGTFSHIWGWTRLNSAPPGFVEAVLADTHLTNDLKTAVLRVYRAFIAHGDEPAQEVP